MKGQPKWDIATIRSVVGRVNLVRTLAPEAKIPEKNKPMQAAYCAGWDDACEVIDRLLRKMTEDRS